MTDLAIQVRLSAEDGGLVGQLRLTRQELDELNGAQDKGGASTRKAKDEQGAFVSVLTELTGAVRELTGAHGLSVAALDRSTQAVDRATKNEASHQASLQATLTAQLGAAAAASRKGDELDAAAASTGRAADVDAQLIAVLHSLSASQLAVVAATDRAAEASLRAAAAGEASADGVRTLGASLESLSPKAQKAAEDILDLGQFAERASASEKELERDIARLRAELDPAGEAARRMARDIEIADTALARGKITQEQHTQAVIRARAASQGNVVSLNQQRAAYQNLGYQVQDITSTLALGISPLVVLAQQGGHTASALSQLGIGGVGGKLISFFAGPFGAVVLAAGVVLGNLATAALTAEDAMEKVTFSSDGLGTAQGILGQVMDLTTGKIVSQREELVALGIAQARVAQIQAEARAQELRGQVSAFGAPRFRIDGGMGGGLNIGYDDGDAGLRAIGRRVLDGGDPVQAIDNLDALRAAGRLTSQEFAEAAAQVASLGTELGNIRINEAAERLLRGVGTADDRGLLFRPGSGSRGRHERKPADPAILENFGLDASDRIERIGAAFTDTPPQIDRVARAMADLDGIMRDVERRKPPNLQQLRDDAERVRPLIEQGINAPLDDFLLRQREALEIGELLAEGRVAEAEALRAILQIEAARGALLPGQREAILGNVQALRDQERQIDRLRQQQASYLAALGDTRALIRDTLFDVRSIADAPDRLLAAFENLQADQLIERYFGETFRELEDQITGAGKAEDASDRLAAAVDRATGSIARLGDAAETAATGVATTAQADEAGEDIVVTGTRDPRSFFAGAIQKLAGNLVGPEAAKLIGEASGKALGGAATGSIVAGVGQLLGIQTSSTGARLGGAAGAFLPIPGGDIVGSILGGLVGSVFAAPAKRGSATIGSVDGEARLSGNDRGLREAAGTLAGGVQSSLQRIIDSLGGEAGGFGVSIGFKDGARGDKYGNFRVDPSGRGRLDGAGVLAFRTEQEAMAAALLDAIRDGAVGGLSAAVSQALSSSKDVEAAVAEALKVDQLEVLVGGPEAALQRSFKAFEREAAERERLARKYGLDLVRLEEATGRERVAMFEGLLGDSVGSLKQLLDDLAGGDLFEGSAAERRDVLRDQIARAEADVAAGVAGAGDRQAELSRQLLELTRDAFGTAGGEFSADRTLVSEAAERAIRVETDRLKAAQDLARGTNDRLDRSNILADETNVLLAQQTALLRQIAAAGAGGAGTGEAFFFGERDAIVR